MGSDHEVPNDLSLSNEQKKKNKNQITLGQRNQQGIWIKGLKQSLLSSTVEDVNLKQKCISYSVDIKWKDSFRRIWKLFY